MEDSWARGNTRPLNLSRRGDDQLDDHVALDAARAGFGRILWPRAVDEHRLDIDSGSATTRTTRQREQGDDRCRRAREEDAGHALPSRMNVA